MRTLVLVAALCMVILVTSSSPIDPKRAPIPYNIPKQHELFTPSPPVKGGMPGYIRPLRKGEYICGDKVCMLKPGEIPKGFHGMCQYSI